MLVSFNCSVLSGTFNPLDSLSVNINKENNENIIVKLGNNHYDFNDFKVDHLKDYICDRRKVADSDRHAVKLWKVDVKDESDIKEKPKEDEMKPRLLFKDYFQDELNGVKFTVSNIHVIAIIPATAGPSQQDVTQGPVVGSLEKALSIILQNIPAKIITSNQTIKLSEKMPLKERDTNEALKVFNENVIQSFDESTAKTNFNFLVCSGAAGIGKTRWGEEFFNSVKQGWTPPWENPHYLYLILDFVNGVRLSSIDKYLEASIILGLRIAYDYFARKKMSFEVFQTLAQPYFDFFKINFVLSSISSHLNAQRLIIILHIDEYQEIFKFEDKWNAALTDKRLFKELMYALGPLMIDSRREYYVQTFLSGTETRKVTKDNKLTEYSFTFVQCPLLSSKSIVEIFDFFAKKEDKEGHWMRNTRILQLLYDTSGLPRALETVLIECFRRETFFQELKDNNFTLFDDMFHAISNRLTNQYKIDKFIMNNRNASYQLLYYSIGAIPVQLDTIISSELKKLTVEELESDGFLILKRVGSNYLVEMPFYFIYIYNTWLNIVPATIHKMLQPDSKMVWETWEIFVANYETFRNNLFVELGEHKEGVSLREFYRGAVGKDSVLEIKMGLKRLDLCVAKNQFPKTGLPINRVDGKIMDLDSFIFVNGHSAPFADVFFLRKTIPEGKNLLIAFQQKWYTTSQKFTIEDAEKECNKNKDAYKLVNDDKLKEFLKECRVVTIIFTPRPFNENPNNLPDDCLVIAQKNFDQYFGPLFASRLSFDIVNRLNINTAEPKQIAERINGIGDVISKEICDKRPYKSVSELIKKNETYKSILEKARVQLEDCLFTPHSFFLDFDEHDTMLIDEYHDSYSSTISRPYKPVDNNTEMDVEY